MVPAKLAALATEVATSYPLTAQPHPLEPTLALARLGLDRVRQVDDYTCVMTKRERVDGVLGEPEKLVAKVMHHDPAQDKSFHGKSPLSLYLKFESPASVRGRELLFCNKAGDGQIIVRKGGKLLPFLTATLEPSSPLAMQGNRYPITEFGIRRLLERMIMLGERELAYDECEVKIDHESDFEGTSCTLIEVRHPVPRPFFRFHLVRIFVDNNLELPFRFESYDWPQNENEEPPLVEEYTYKDLNLNVGLTDADFERDHPQYRFSRKRSN